MRTLSILVIICSVFLLSSCSRHTHVHKTTRIPPGQAKKMTGDKSAKTYAPGQTKKMTGAKSAKEYAPGQQKK